MHLRNPIAEKLGSEKAPITLKGDDHHMDSVFYTNENLDDVINQIKNI